MEHCYPKRRTIAGIVQGIDSYERESLSKGQLVKVHVYFIEQKNGDFVEVHSNNSVEPKEGQQVFVTYEEVEKEKTTYSYIDEDGVIVEGFHKTTGNFATNIVVKKANVATSKENAVAETIIETAEGVKPEKKKDK